MARDSAGSQALAHHRFASPVPTRRSPPREVQNLRNYLSPLAVDFLNCPSGVSWVARRPTFAAPRLSHHQPSNVQTPMWALVLVRPLICQRAWKRLDALGPPRGSGHSVFQRSFEYHHIPSSLREVVRKVRGYLRPRAVPATDGGPVPSPRGSGRCGHPAARSTRAQRCRYRIPPSALAALTPHPTSVVVPGRSWAEARLKPGGQRHRV